MHIFTSVTVNYIPKARVLAASVKKHHPDAQFHLVLSDKQPDWLDLGKESFDSIINIQELNIPNFNAWVFKHSLVELCTAVKGFAFQEILRRFDAQKVVYLDPDIVAISPLDSIIEKLDNASILLTPHQTDPEDSLEGIADNEICSLKHGVFNLGFLAIRASAEGKRFIDWWAHRLAHFCYDDIPAGLFTDQRWVDLVPCFFSDLLVMRDPIYNVSTWNLSNRVVTGTFDKGFLVNGEKLCFYHFSGFDSGAQQLMLDKYGKQSPALKDLRNWYVEECRLAGQNEYGQTPCDFGFFENGKPITRAQRLLYRSRIDLQDYFKDPYSTQDVNKSYFNWYLANVSQEATGIDPEAESPQMLREALMSAQNELTDIKNSRIWQILKFLASLLGPLGKRIP